MQIQLFSFFVVLIVKILEQKWKWANIVMRMGTQQQQQQNGREYPDLTTLFGVCTIGVGRFRILWGGGGGEGGGGGGGGAKVENIGGGGQGGGQIPSRHMTS